MKTLIAIFILSLSFQACASSKLTLATYNIRNFDYDDRSNIPTNKKQLVATLESISPDLMGIQEIQEKEIFKQLIQEQFNQKYKTVLTNCGGSHEQKLGFIYNTEKFELLKFNEDLRTANIGSPTQSNCAGSRPLAIAVFRNLMTNESLVAISVHLKSGGQPKSIAKRFKQLSALKDVVLEHKAQNYKNFVVMGDFNSTEFIFKSKYYQKFMHLISSMGLEDSSKNLSCTSYWWGQRDDQTQYPSQLDHILVSKSILQKKSSTSAASHGHCQKLRCQATLENQMGVDFNEVSDHCPISVELK